MTQHLSDIQKDALTEIFNIGAGQAAAGLSQIVGEAITLSVPRLSILHNIKAKTLNEFISSPRISAVSQDFTGSINAKAFLVFPEDKTKEIVRRMLGNSASADELREMEQEALCEIGNIILNSCMSSLSEALQAGFQCSMPAYHMGLTDNVLSSYNAGDSNSFMFFMINFSMHEAKIDGYLVFLLNLPSFKVLVEQVDQFLLSITL